MGRISTGVGLISGINSKDIIDQLMSLESRPKLMLQSRVDKTNQQKLAYTDILTRLSSLKLIFTKLKKPSSFQAAAATSTNESILTASADKNAAIGSYTFQVARLVTSQQSISAGFADKDKSRVGIATGQNMAVTADTLLSDLRSGAGIRLGSISITDRSGATATVNLTGASTIDDVLEKITAASGISVGATLSGSQIVITDSSGGAGTLSIAESGGGNAAADLGILGSGVDNVLTGTALVGAAAAGTISIEMGGGELTSAHSLADLNGGAGVRRGTFRITDRSGRSAMVDISASLTLDDVVKKINTTLDVSVRAQVKGDGLFLMDLSGGTGTLAVQDLGSGHAAEDLGLTADQDADAATLTGASINRLGPLTTLAQLNDGRGVRRASSGADFTVTVGADSFDITLGSAKSIGDVLSTLNAAAPTRFAASVSADGHGLKLTSTGGETITVTAANGSKAAADLGIENPTNAGSTLDGSWVLSRLNTVMVSSLSGGAGLALGSIKITDRAGAVHTIDLSAARTVQDVLDTIGTASGGKITASLNAANNGIQIADASGGSGNLVVENVDLVDTTATKLGLAGTFDLSRTAVRGANLQRQWVSENTLLKDFNGGKGVTPGKFKITNSTGSSSTISITDSETTIGDVIRKINERNLGVTASINANGDGILLTDTAGGAGTLTVEESGGTTAGDLGIRRTASGTTIDGSMERTITLTSTDTLASVANKINDLGFGISAAVINDGSSNAPYRLSLTARNSGYDGRFVFDGGETLLATSNLIDAQDAALFLGGSGAQQPLLVTSGTNTVKDVIRGVTLDLHGAGDSPVTVNVTRDIEDVVKEMQQFADSFNEMSGKIAELTAFNTQTNTGGLLLGDSTIQQAQAVVYQALSSVISDAGRYRLFADVGIKLADKAKIEFDADKFKAAYATDPEAVTRLFTLTETKAGTLTEKGLGAMMEKAITRLTDPVDGILTRQNKALDQRTQGFQSRIASMEKLLESKRARLERQFASMETVLANLQQQQAALSQMQTISYTTNSSSK